jgi:hypothetical protein
MFLLAVSGIAWILKTSSLKGSNTLLNDGSQMYGADRDYAEAFIILPRLEIHGTKSRSISGGTTSRLLIRNISKRGDILGTDSGILFLKP